jgi:L-seryl-tRNA(Ser) seleniumtransferase
MKKLTKQGYLRKIPSVNEVLGMPELQQACARVPRAAVLRVVRTLLAEKRSTILAMAEEGAAEDALSMQAIQQQVIDRLQKTGAPSLTRVINATGVVIHTNLGRAPLAEEAIQRVAEISRRYNNLEFDSARGERGDRHVHVRKILQDLCGAEDVLVVNNNAAAVLLCLSTLARGKEVIISRGELIEIGGSFRIPEIMEQSGARLREVGTTNRTHLQDFRAAINEHTALILKVHPSNYKIEGFTAEASLSELRDLGAEFHIPVMFDMGSGNLVNAESLGMEDEPTVQDALQQGVDLITFSGDKLVGGPQSGIILGKSEYINLIVRHPLIRALRIDKLTLAALEETLRLYYLDPDFRNRIPVLQMLSVSAAALKRRAQAMVRDIKKRGLPLEVFAMKDSSKTGGGSYPVQGLSTWVVSLTPLTMTPQDLESSLRGCSPSIITRISKERVMLDMRTLFPEEAGIIVRSLDALLRQRSA